ncbi:MAG: HXXEE domain-containing protein [Lewinellaceae bacterium]|nr:HXXEE domain-containing protein [Phaeodactylibacter sp.]MCB9035726.1 HXXEE domain-containing protein [Lewinellaceae bacterium]
MKPLSPTLLAWLLPATYLIHLLEEYYAGGGFPAWLSAFMNADLSTNDFLIINGIAWPVMAAFAVAYTLGWKNQVVLLALWTVLFVNGLLHPLSCLASASYAPGTFSAVLLYLPLGFLAFRSILPGLSVRQRNAGIAAGLLIHLAVIVLANTI